MANYNGTEGDDTYAATADGDTIAGNGGDDTLDGAGGDDTIDGGLGDDVIDGGDGADTIIGGAGFWDTLIGGAGTDNLDGGAGNDRYVIGSAGEHVAAEIHDSGSGSFEFNEVFFTAATGTLTIFAGESGITHVYLGNTSFDASTAPTNVDASGYLGDLALIGNGGANQLTGGSGYNNMAGYGGDDILNGGDGNDNLDGGSGVDQLYGGTGNDYYNVDSAADQVFEVTGAGADWVQASASYTLAAGQEIETLGTADGPNGTGAINLTGNEFDNSIFGNAAANQLVGGAGNDGLTGGDGDDVLQGGDGNDGLSGGEGDDQMAGGAGDDFYSVDSALDVVIENAGEGRDSIDASISFSLAGISVEDIRAAYGSGAINLTGNALNNFIEGNAAANHLSGAAGDDNIWGYEGDDWLEGGDGNDSLIGSEGDDLIDGGAGIDWAQYGVGISAGVTVNLAILGVQETGGAGIDTLTGIENLFGSVYNDVLTGNAGANILWSIEGNDILDGGAGADQLIGGTGDDTYVVDTGFDAISEYAEEGTDLVKSSVDWTLGANLENLRLTGTTAILGDGNSLNNAITGNSAANKLNGFDGNDRLNGGAGTDRMYGSNGDDVYYADSYSDKAVENTGEGTDAVFASTNFKLGANVERLTLTGSADLWGYGNELANTLVGNSGANRLYGLAGSDTLNGGTGGDWLEGGAGQDRLYGGAGNDSFVFRDGDFGGATAAMADQVKDFANGDKIRLNLVDANTGLDGDQAFAFIGTGAFSGAAGELRYEQISGNTYVTGDTNGDGIADFMIRVDGLHTLVGTDFGL